MGQDWLTAIGLINTNSIEVDKLTTQEFPLEKLISDGFQAMKEKKCVKQLQFNEV